MGQMENRKTEETAREEILEAVRTYCETYHNRTEAYQKGERICYAARVYDSSEMINLVDSALDFWLTAGKYTEQFEKCFSQFLGIKYCSLVNSGSSANLLAFMALTSPLLGDRRIRRGDEVITAAAGFPTTVSPMIQYGAVPVFVDMALPECNIDVSLLEAAVSEKTKAVMVAHTLGNPFDLYQVRQFCRSHGLWLIEDNCDALGSEYWIDGQWKYTGTVGDIGTSSFYPPHHMTMGEGGAVYTDNAVLHKIIRSMRDWGRDCVCAPGQDGFCGHRFDRQYGSLPKGYDHKYVYSHFGYNLKASDMQAAVGCAQLEKLAGFISKRREHFEKLKNGLADLQDYYLLPEAEHDSRPSWFGFLLTCTEQIKRDTVVHKLEEAGIQTRMLFAGNLTKHPCFDELRESRQGYRVAGELKVTDQIMERSFWVGVYPGLTPQMTDYMIEALRQAALGTQA